MLKFQHLFHLYFMTTYDYIFACLKVFNRTGGQKNLRKVRTGSKGEESRELVSLPLLGLKLLSGLDVFRTVLPLRLQQYTDDKLVLACVLWGYMVE